VYSTHSNLQNAVAGQCPVYVPVTSEALLLQQLRGSSSASSSLATAGCSAPLRHTQSCAFHVSTCSNTASRCIGRLDASQAGANPADLTVSAVTDNIGQRSFHQSHDGFATFEVQRQTENTSSWSGGSRQNRQVARHEYKFYSYNATMLNVLLKRASRQHVMMHKAITSNIAHEEFLMLLLCLNCLANYEFFHSHPHTACQ